MIRPRLRTGAKTPERVATTTRGCAGADPPPLLGALGVAETRSAESPRGRRSGGRTGRPRRASVRSPAPAAARRGPWPGAASIAFRYTSVLPDPVTPCSRNVWNWRGLEGRPESASKAACWCGIQRVRRADRADADGNPLARRRSVTRFPCGPARGPPCWRSRPLPRDPSDCASPGCSSR